jgi:anti-sigma regulatory factor (Ser/Thr protein kinase)
VAHEDFDNDLASVRIARSWAAARLDGVDLDVAKLLVTELATNAVLHARTGFTVRIHVDDECVRVSVTDADPSIPSATTPAPGDSGGRGLFLVNQLAARWGIDPDPPGKTVWFELAKH